MAVLGADDLLTTKLLALTEHNLDYSPLLEYARSLREQIDWASLRARTDGSPFARRSSRWSRSSASVHGTQVAPPARPRRTARPPKRRRRRTRRRVVRDAACPTDRDARLCARAPRGGARHRRPPRAGRPARLDRRRRTRDHRVGAGDAAAGGRLAGRRRKSRADFRVRNETTPVSLDEPLDDEVVE